MEGRGSVAAWGLPSEARPPHSLPRVRLRGSVARWKAHQKYVQQERDDHNSVGQSRLPGTVQKGSVIPAAATSQCREGTAGVRLRRKQDQKEDPEGMGGGRERGPLRL
jgi:hypothetical protein